MGIDKVRSTRVDEFLTLGKFKDIVQSVVLNFRRFISAVIGLGLLAGGVPYVACTPAVCAANAECAAVHCNCCGPNCPWSKNSPESHKHATDCNQHCPLINASTAVMTNSVQVLAPATSGIGEVQPFLIAYTAFYAPPVRPPASVHPSTLLSLSCALTV
jgi:hypothetical protein